MDERLVDEEDRWLLKAHRWQVLTHRTQSGRFYRYLEARIGGFRVLFHRLLLGAAPGRVVDHINGNGMDNRRANLRECSHAENMRNRRRNANHAHGFKGVGRRPNGRYYAQIRAGEVRRTRGGFATPEEAATAYAAMAVELHGAFAQFDLPPVRGE